MIKMMNFYKGGRGLSCLKDLPRPIINTWRQVLYGSKEKRLRKKDNDIVKFLDPSTPFNSAQDDDREGRIVHSNKRLPRHSVSRNDEEKGGEEGTCTKSRIDYKEKEGEIPENQERYREILRIVHLLRRNELFRGVKFREIKFLFREICNMADKYSPKCAFFLFTFLCFSGLLTAVQAQSRQDIGAADGRSSGPFRAPTENSLYLGDRVPDSFFAAVHTMVDMRTKEVYTGTLEAHRNKLIILDFWATWCMPCLGSLKHLHELAPLLDPAQVAIVPVTYEDLDKLDGIMDRFGWSHRSITGDTLLGELFPHQGIPHMVWIKDGWVAAMPRPTYATAENIGKAIAGYIPEMVQTLEVKVADYSRPLFSADNASSEIIYRDSLLKVAGYVDEYAPIELHRTDTGDSTFVSMVNQPLDVVFYNVFHSQISPFLPLFDGGAVIDVPDSLKASFLEGRPSYSDRAILAQDTLVTAWERSNLYSIDYRIPATSTERDLGDGLRERVKVFAGKHLGLDLEIARTEPKNYPVITLAESTAQTLKRMASPLPDRLEDTHLQYPPRPDNLAKLVYVISYLMGKVKDVPLDYHTAVDRTGISAPAGFVFEVPKVLFYASELSFAQVHDFAGQFGLKIKTEYSPQPYLRITTQYTNLNTF